MQAHVMVDVRSEPEVEATQLPLAGLPSLLSTLSTYPDPTTALNTLVTRALSRYRVRGAGLWRTEADNVRMIARYGHSPEEADQWLNMPRGSQFPVVRCIEAGQIFTYTPNSYLGSFPGLRNVSETEEEIQRYLFGEEEPESETNVGAVVVPIAARGIVIGCLGFMTLGVRVWTANELTTLSTYSSALALWLSNDCRVTEADTSAPRITERQRVILGMIWHGHSNSVIADRLGIPLTTVKQEIQRTCVAFDAASRSDAAARARALGCFDA